MATGRQPAAVQGCVSFPGSKRPPALWIRLPADCSAPLACQVLTASRTKVLRKLGVQPWGLPPPSVLISVTGAADATIGQLAPQARELFVHGLREVTRNTGAWLTSGGTESGVMKLVGQIVREQEDAGARTVCLGVAPWGAIRGREAMSRDPVTLYEKAAYTQSGETADLDQNHSHFLLADDGDAAGFGSEIALRTRLEEHLCQTVPNVLVVVGGGKGTLETIYQSLQKRRPCVVLADSGGVARDLYRYFEGLDERGEPIEPSQRLPPPLSAHDAARLGHDAVEYNQSVRDLLPKLARLFDQQQAAAEEEKAALDERLRTADQRVTRHRLDGRFDSRAAGRRPYMRPLRFFKLVHAPGSAAGAMAAVGLEPLHHVLIDAILGGHGPAAAMACAVGWGDPAVVQRLVVRIRDESRLSSTEVRIALLAGFERSLIEVVQADESKRAVEVVRTILACIRDEEIGAISFNRLVSARFVDAAGPSDARLAAVPSSRRAGETGVAASAASDAEELAAELAAGSPRPASGKKQRDPFEVCFS